MIYSFVAYCVHCFHILINKEKYMFIWQTVFMITRRITTGQLNLNQNEQHLFHDSV